MNGDLYPDIVVAGSYETTLLENVAGTAGQLPAWIPRSVGGTGGTPSGVAVCDFGG
jgi:hypothetical protein